MNDARIGWRIREQMQVFSGKVCAGLPKVAQRLVREVLYGVQARGSVRLSEIGRSLGEATAMKKSIERLGRGLERPGLRHQVRKNLLALAASRIDNQTLLVVDPTDLTKPYAKKMEYLARVRDGSKKELADGFWCCEVVAAHRGTATVGHAGDRVEHLLYSIQDAIRRRHLATDAIQGADSPAPIPPLRCLRRLRDDKDDESGSSRTRSAREVCRKTARH